MTDAEHTSDPTAYFQVGAAGSARSTVAGPMPGTFAISIFDAPARYRTRPTRVEVAWSQLVARFTEHDRRRDKDGRGWTGATYEPGTTRANENALEWSVAVADRDHCTVADVDSTSARMSERGLAYVLYSTYGNAPPHDVRFRVVVPLTVPVPAGRWRDDIWHRLNAALFEGHNDPQTKDAGRMFYDPSAPPDVAVFSQHGAGLAVDWTQLPEVHRDLGNGTHEWRAPDDAERDGVTVLLIANAWPCDGGRHAFILAVTGALARRGVDAERITELVAAAAQRAGDAAFLAESGWRGELTRAAEGAISRLRGGADEPVAGFPALSELAPATAAALGGVWSVPSAGRIEFRAADAIPDSAGGRTRSCPASNWAPKKLSELAAVSDETRWQWYGYLAGGEVTLLTALWKSGKTTLVSYLLRASCDRLPTFAGLALRWMRVLIISEESERMWAERRDELGMSDAVHVLSRPFKGRPDPRTWEAFVQHVAGLVASEGYDLVVFDSLPNLWSVRDENDAAQVLAALAPIHAVTGAGAAVLLVAHPSKGDQSEGRATRGSGAIGGWVDVIVEMRRYDPERREDTRRVLTSFSRYDATPPEVVLNFTDGEGYEVIGGKAETKAADRWRVLAEILPADGNGLTPQEVRGEWPEDGAPKPSEKTIRRDLDAALKRNLVKRTGDGIKDDPFRYRLATIPDKTPDAPCPESDPTATPSEGQGRNSMPDSSGGIEGRILSGISAQPPSANGNGPIPAGGGPTGDPPVRRVGRENQACAMCLRRPADGGDLCRDCEDRLEAWTERAPSA